MQEYIVNGLLIVVALLAVILQIIGTRPSAGMTKKQKVMLWRILAAAVLLLILQFLGAVNVKSTHDCRVHNIERGKHSFQHSHFHSDFEKQTSQMIL